MSDTIDDLAGDIGPGLAAGRRDSHRQTEALPVLNFVPISDTLGTAGQPTREQFAALREAGYDVVVNLALPTSSNALPDEAEVVTTLGMEYVHIPVVWESPTLADLGRFFQTMERHQGRKVLVHCALNMRVSAFVFLYRVLRLGVPEAEARATMRRIWEPDGIWADLIQKTLDHGVSPAGDRDVTEENVEP